ncbi:MAG: VOC family protein [Acidimicrobiales bacterium]
MPTRESYDHGTPSWVDLMTTDPAGAQAFYGEIFGWDFEDNPTPDGQVYTMASKGGRSAAGMGAQPPEQIEMGIPPMWNTYLTVDDIAAAAGKAEGAGGSVMMPPMEVMEAGSMAVVVDPSGAVVCMWQPGQHIGCEVVNEHGALIWNELLTDNIEAAAPFYNALFGLNTSEVDMGGGMMYTLLECGEAQVAGMMPPPMEGIPNHWSTYFAVDDADATVAKIQELGGSVMGPAFDVPGVGRMAAIQDPQGANFMIMQPEAQA